LAFGASRESVATTEQNVINWLDALQRVQASPMCTTTTSDKAPVLTSAVSTYVESDIAQVDTWFSLAALVDNADPPTTTDDLFAVSQLLIVMSACTSIQVGREHTRIDSVITTRVRMALSGGDDYSTVATPAANSDGSASARRAAGESLFTQAHCRRLALVMFASVLQDRYLMYAVGRTARSAFHNTVNALQSCSSSVRTALGANSIRVQLYETTRDERLRLPACIRERTTAAAAAASPTDMLLAAMQCSYRTRWVRTLVTPLVEVHQAEVFAFVDQTQRSENTAGAAVTTVFVTPGLLKPPWFSADFALDSVLARLGFAVLAVAGDADLNDDSDNSLCAARDRIALATLEQCFPSVIAQPEFWIDLLQLWCVAPPPPSPQSPATTHASWRLGAIVGSHVLPIDHQLRHAAVPTCADSPTTTTTPPQPLLRRTLGARLTRALLLSNAFVEAFRCVKSAQ
jgi:hypothetical protein